MTATTRAHKLRLCLIGLVATIVLWACGSGDDPTVAPQSSGTSMDHGSGGAMGAEPTCSPEGSSLMITANNTTFNKECLAVPANQPFTIALDNKQTLTHSLAILEGHTSSNVLFRGDIFAGPKSTTYNVAGLPPGTYVFHCEVHPGQMRGTFIVK